MGVVVGEVGGGPFPPQKKKLAELPAATSADGGEVSRTEFSDRTAATGMRAQPSLLRGASSAGVSAGALWHMLRNIFLSFCLMANPDKPAEHGDESRLQFECNVHRSAIEPSVGEREREGEGERERERERGRER